MRKRTSAGLSGSCEKVYMIKPLAVWRGVKALVWAALALKGTHGAEALTVAEILQKTKNDHCDGDQRKHVSVREAGHGADQRDDRAGGSDHGETE